MRTKKTKQLKESTTLALAPTGQEASCPSTSNPINTKPSQSEVVEGIPVAIPHASPSQSEKQSFIARFMATYPNDAASEIARLAALMAPSSPVFDSAVLISQAIQIREEAAIATHQRQHMLLVEADWFCLNALWRHLAKGIADSLQKSDPTLKAIIEQMMQRNETQTAAWYAAPEREQEQAEVDRAFAEIALESGALPSLPCKFEEALRWSVTASTDTPWTLIESAFIDFLNVTEAKHIYEQESGLSDPDRGSKLDALNWICRYRQALAVPQITPEQRKQHEEQLAKHQATVTEVDSLSDYVSNFSPGSPPPKIISAHGSAAYAKYWRGKEVDQKNLCFITSEFRPFWQKHSPAYGKALKDEVRAAEALRLLKKDAGEDGAAERTRRRWVCFTQGFWQWSNRKKITPERISQFPKQKDMVLSKGREFLNTLLAAKNHPSLRAELSETLDNVGIKISSEIVADCYAVLFERKIIKS